jgi:hypothetical protein
MGYSLRKISKSSNTRASPMTLFPDLHAAGLEPAETSLARAPNPPRR